MRLGRLVTLALVLLATPALAQDAAPADVVPAADAAPAEVIEGGSFYLIDDTASVRFMGEDTPGGSFRKDEEVTVLFRDGDMARVRRGDRYGWIPATALTATTPAGALDGFAPPPTTAPAGEFDLERLQELLQKTEGGL